MKWKWLCEGEVEVEDDVGVIVREASVGKRCVGVEREDIRGFGVCGEVYGVDVSECGFGGGVKWGGVGVGLGVN